VAHDEHDRPNRYGELWADVYDDEHAFMVPPDAQLGVLADLVGNGRALELGIGTGRVALPLAKRGIIIEGIDASPSMVARLRAKPGGEGLQIVIGDMATLDVSGPFRLVYVMFNTIFALLTQDAQIACFRRVADLLEPSGCFCLECFVPDLGRFNDAQSIRTVSVDDDGVRVDASRHDPVTQQITSAIIHIRADGTSVRPMRLRYVWPAELDLMARLAGLRLRDRWGDWNGGAFTAESRAHITVYQKP
jgi:SAM-dependent methyltransferase